MAHIWADLARIASHSLEPNAKTKMALGQRRRPCDAAIALGERIDINLPRHCPVRQLRHFLGNQSTATRQITDAH